jgi:hypothetical protein
MPLVDVGVVALTPGRQVVAVPPSILDSSTWKCQRDRDDGCEIAEARAFTPSMRLLYGAQLARVGLASRQARAMKSTVPARASRDPALSSLPFLPVETAMQWCSAGGRWSACIQCEARTEIGQWRIATKSTSSKFEPNQASKGYYFRAWRLQHARSSFYASS